MALLELNHVTKTFSGLTAVADFSQTVEAGEIVGLIGPNGAGKSTIFNLITKTYPIDKGEIRFDGHDIAGIKAHQMAHIGLGRCFQVVKPFGEMTVFDNIMVGAFCGVSDISKARAGTETTLDFLGMQPLTHQKAKNLTIADRKRLELARALATRPKLLLLDEVMAGLNPKEIDDIIVLIKKIRDRGITILLIEHVMKAVMTLSDRISIVHFGEKITEGNPEEIAKDERVIKAYLGEEYVFTKNH